MGKPVEIAHSVAYIFENDYYTGRVLELDGGLRLQFPASACAAPSRLFRAGRLTSRPRGRRYSGAG